MTGGHVDSLDRTELLFVLGVVAVLVSGLLPWLTATEPIPVSDPSERAEGLGSFSGADTTERVLGIDRVEWVVLAGVALVAAAVVLTEPWSRVVLGVGVLSAVVALAVGARYLSDPIWLYSDWLDPELGAVTSVGPGVYLALVGGALQAVGCSLGVREPEPTGAGSLDRPPGGDGRQPPQDQPRTRHASRTEQQSAQQQPRQQAEGKRPEQERAQNEGSRRSPEREEGQNQE